MPSLTDSEIRGLLEQPNPAVITTLNADGSPHSTVVWISVEDGAAAVNSAVGRVWPTNLARDPRVTLLVMENGNGNHYVEIKGTAHATQNGADEHINALSKKYIGEDEYPFRAAGEERVKFVVTPRRVRYVNQ